MSLLLSLRKRLIFPALLAIFPVSVWSQITATPQSNEYSLGGSLVGDQVRSSLSLNQNGGYLVFEENSSKKNGMQIGAIRLNSSLTKISSFPVNKVTTGDQVKPQVQLLGNGDAIFLWQSYGLGNADIYARVLKDDGTFLTGDVRVNSDSKVKGSFAKDQQSEPVVCALNDGSAMVAWQSLNQDGNMMGIYGRRISSTGSMATNEFLINQTTDFNQRSPAIAALPNGNVVVVWISEFQRFGSPLDPLSPVSIDVYARVLDASGNPVTGEKLLNSGNNICANPSVAALPNGGFTVAWSEKDVLSHSNSWEIMGRNFSSEGDATGADFKINSFSYGDQYQPKIAAVGNDCAVVWTSLGQDGNRQGVYGRLLQSGAQPSGDEFRVNNTTVSQQMFPAVAASGSNQFLVSWSSFVAVTGFDLFGRKYNVNQQ